MSVDAFSMAASNASPSLDQLSFEDIVDALSDTGAAESLLLRTGVSKEELVRRAEVISKELSEALAEANMV